MNLKKALSPSSVTEVNPIRRTHQPYMMGLEPGAIVIGPARAWHVSDIQAGAKLVCSI